MNMASSTCFQRISILFTRRYEQFRALIGHGDQVTVRKALADTGGRELSARSYGDDK